MIEFLIIVLGYGFGCFLYENVIWFLKCWYYRKYNDNEKLIITSNSLIYFSNTIITFTQDGYDLKFDFIMTFNCNKYRAILIKNN